LYASCWEETDLTYEGIETFFSISIILLPPLEETDLTYEGIETTLYGCFFGPAKRR